MQVKRTVPSGDVAFEPFDIRFTRRKQINVAARMPLAWSLKIKT
jgi:hypothetical protein